MIFFHYLKHRHHRSWVFFFKLDFFFYYLFVYSVAVIFFIRQVLCFCLTLVLAIRVLTLKRSAVGSAKHLRNQQAGGYPSTRPLPRVEKEEGGKKEGKHCWESHTGSQLTRNSQVLRISIMEPLVNCRWLEAYFTVLYQSLCILLTLFHWVEAIQFYEPPPILY